MSKIEFGLILDLGHCSPQSRLGSARNFLTIVLNWATYGPFLSRALCKYSDSVYQ